MACHRRIGANQFDHNRNRLQTRSVVWWTLDLACANGCSLDSKNKTTQTVADKNVNRQSVFNLNSLQTISTDTILKVTIPDVAQQFRCILPQTLLLTNKYSPKTFEYPSNIQPRQGAEAVPLQTREETGGGGRQGLVADASSLAFGCPRDRTRARKFCGCIDPTSTARTKEEFAILPPCRRPPFVTPRPLHRTPVVDWCARTALHCTTARRHSRHFRGV